jgi:hypothetical protein
VAGGRTNELGLAACETRATRSDAAAAARHLEVMPKHRKRSALDLFLEALTHPVRYR